jgi:cyclase
MEKSGSEHYAFEEIGDGIRAAIARWGGKGICNSGIVDLGDGAVVFDTSCTLPTAQELWAETQSAFGRPPSLAANSHWHLDHALGNPGFSTVPVWATRRTREIFLEMQDQMTAELTKEALDRDIRGLEEQRGSMPSESSLKDLEFTINFVRALASEATHLRLSPPDHTFETRLVLPGDHGAELVSFGSGHTEADAILFLRSEKVVFAGDLVVAGQQPSMGSSNPDHWPIVLDEIEALGPERIIPGHGPVVSLDGLGEIREYLSAIVKVAGATGVTSVPAPLRPWEGSPTFKENLKFAQDWVVAHSERK